MAHSTVRLAKTTYDTGGEPATVNCANGLNLAASTAMPRAGNETDVETSDGTTTGRPVARSHRGTVRPTGRT